MEIINGKKIAQEILSDLKKEIRAKKLKPCLAVILIGNDPASCLYVRLKEKAAQEIGIEIKKHILPEQISEKEVLEIIKSLNQNSEINGILVQMPLPKSLCPDKIIKEIALEKDVDGFLFESRFDSPFILSIWQALKQTKEDLQNKKIFALVNSDIFGKALKKFFKKKGLGINYLGMRFPNIWESHSQNFLKKADVIITALGQPHFIKGPMIKKGAILIDGGISKKGKKVLGDINAQAVQEKASWLSPVPGGLGPITIAFLLKNVFLAAKRQ